MLCADLIVLIQHALQACKCWPYVIIHCRARIEAGLLFQVRNMHTICLEQVAIKVCVLSCQDAHQGRLAASILAKEACMQDKFCR